MEKNLQATRQRQALHFYSSSSKALQAYMKAIGLRDVITKKMFLFTHASEQNMHPRNGNECENQSFCEPIRLTKHVTLAQNIHRFLMRISILIDEWALRKM